MGCPETKLLVYFDNEEHLVRRLGSAVISCWSNLPRDIKAMVFERAKLVIEDDDTAHLDEDLRRFIAEHSDPCPAPAEDTR